MKRYRVNKFRDSRKFASTANKTKTINLGAVSYRGGLRL